MVVQIDACRFTPAAIPLEDEPPLLVGADRMEAFKIAAPLFEVVTGILIMSALEKSGPAFLVPGRANRDPFRTSVESAESTAVGLAAKRAREVVAVLKFHLDDFFWTANAQLPSWAGYQTRRGAYGSVSSSAPSDGSVTVTFAPEGRDTAPLLPDELASVQWLLDHDRELASALLKGLLAEYPKLQGLYGYEGAERDEWMPDISSPDDFRSLIGLHNVNVHPVTKDSLPYLGYEFGCSWDVEHGLGVLMHGLRVVKIGGADTAILLWIAERDARGAE